MLQVGCQAAHPLLGHILSCLQAAGGGHTYPWWGDMPLQGFLESQRLTRSFLTVPPQLSTGCSPFFIPSSPFVAPLPHPPILQHSQIYLLHTTLQCQPTYRGGACHDPKHALVSLPPLLLFAFSKFTQTSSSPKHTCPGNASICKNGVLGVLGTCLSSLYMYRDLFCLSF